MKWYLYIICQTNALVLLSQAEIPDTFNQAMMLAAGDDLENVAGSPYLYQEFKPGDIYYGGKNKIEQIPLRLDIYRDRLEYRDKKGTVMAFSNPDRMDRIVIGDEVFVYLPKGQAYRVSGFLKQWNANLPSLLTKMHISFKRGEEKKPFDLHDPKPDRLERVADNHFILKSNDEIEKVTSVKKLIRYLGSHTEELTEYAKKEAISAKEPNELAKLVNYYLQLESQ